MLGLKGAGKSTLISLIPRIYNPTAGEILVDGVSVMEIDPHALREVIGFVPQDDHLLLTLTPE